MREISRMRKTLIGGVVVLGSMVGCASDPGSTARNVSTGATINAVAGTPGAGIVGLAAMAVELFSGIGRPEVKQVSQELSDLIATSPNYRNENGKTQWLPRKGKDGKIYTIENSTERSRRHFALFASAIERFGNCDFGDTPETKEKNLLAWKNEKQVVAEYAEGDAKIVIVSEGGEPGEAMTGEEWTARLQAGMKN